MITVFSDNKEIKTNYMLFSDGAITYKLEGWVANPRYISINVDPCTPVRDIREELTCILDCIYQVKFKSNVKLILNIPYFPYGRCDRKFEEGNPIMLENFCYWLRDYVEDFDEIHTCDIHNESPARYILGEVLHVKQQLGCYRESLPCDFSTKYDYVISPDKGATMKSVDIANYLGQEVGLQYAGKKRCIETGRIIETTLPEDIDFTGAKCLIPDDICDGGFTFIKLAEKLRERGAIQVDLYVTHLIAAKGLKMLDGVIDNLYYYHIVGKHINNEDVLNFNNKNI